jgi:excisionase family DNA binding protein
MIFSSIDTALRALMSELLEPLMAEVRELKAAISLLGDKGSRASVSAEYISIPSAAQLIEVDPRTIRAWISDGQLRAYGSKGTRRVRIDELHNLMAAGSPSNKSDVIDLTKRARQMLEGSKSKR